MRSCHWWRLQRFPVACSGARSVWSAASPRRFSFHTTQSGEGFVFVAVRRPTISPAPLTRRPFYHGDILSRLAPSSELSECHSFCGIRSLVEGRTIGAYFAEAIGVHLTF